MPRCRFIDHVMLLMVIVAHPLQEQFDAIAGVSLSFWTFGIAVLYLACFYPQRLIRTIQHRVFLWAFVFVYLAFVIETLHYGTDYGEIVRFSLMIIGGVSVASLINSREMLRTAVLGFVISGLWLAGLLVLESYGAWQSASAVDFQVASRMRGQLAAQSLIAENLNRVGLIVAQGVIAALVILLTCRHAISRLFVAAIVLLLLVGTFLPASRAGIVTVAVSATVVLWKGSRTRAQRLAWMAAILLAAIILVPSAVWSRASIDTGSPKKGAESRVKLYAAAVTHFQEYILTGVGNGNFQQSWGWNSDFASERVVGAHNCFIQVAIYWGLPGLVCFGMLAWNAARCLPQIMDRDALKLFLFGIAVSTLLRTLFMHQIYAKEFSLCLGLLVGNECWIWPKHRRGPRVSTAFTTQKMQNRVRSSMACSPSE